MLVAEPEMISSSHRRPRAIALTRRARRSMRVGRTSFRGMPSGKDTNPKREEQTVEAALIVANEFLEAQIEELQADVSKGYVRG
jgi:hypothetical protein